MANLPPRRPALRLTYRLRQFWHALRARRDPHLLEAARAALTPRLWALFLQMPPNEQAHALRVFARLRRAGCTDPDTLTAALLHDVGKALQRPRLWERVIVVLAQGCCPQQTLRWGKGAPQGWRRPFVLAAQHPQWGAELAARAGASRRAVELIRRHQDPSANGDHHLALLQWADAQE